MVNDWLAPPSTEIRPEGEILPPVLAAADMAQVFFAAKLAPTLRSPFMVIRQVVLVPEHAPDHPPKIEFASGVAVRVTVVPPVKVVPAGLLVTVPDPPPDLAVRSV